MTVTIQYPVGCERAGQTRELELDEIVELKDLDGYKSVIINNGDTEIMVTETSYREVHKALQESGRNRYGVYQIVFVDYDIPGKKRRIKSIEFYDE